MKIIYRLSGIFLFISAQMILLSPLTDITAEAKLAADPVNAKTNTNMSKLTPELCRKIMSTTSAEPDSSDLILEHGATRLSTRRIPQGYTSDGTYYYFLSNISTSGKNKNDLRLTRVKYLTDGSYQEDFMTLKGFGHGTNLDCVNIGGKTWLWTGSDAKGGTGASTSISCFTYKKGKTLKKHAGIHFKIPASGRKHASNCYPAVSADGSRLSVRYTGSGGQTFKVYKLKKGKSIDVRHPLKTVRISKTAGDFQGFDIRGTVIYTIEGTASKAEMRELHKKWYSIRIRIYDYKTGKKRTISVKGAAKLSHREPEGIQVAADGTMYPAIASHYQNKYTCMNIYKYK